MVTSSTHKVLLSMWVWYPKSMTYYNKMVRQQAISSTGAHKLYFTNGSIFVGILADVQVLMHLMAKYCTEAHNLCPTSIVKARNLANFPEQGT